LIIATRVGHRKLSAPCEEKYSGRGVSYCATYDGFLFKGEKVVIVDGRNSALIDALYLKNLGANVRIIHRRKPFRAKKQFHLVG